MARAVVTREQWLAAGYERFGRSGLAGLKVEAMAASLGSSKAGFYWYFKSRAAFERALFEHWRERETQQIIAAAESAGAPLQKLLRLVLEVMTFRSSADFTFYLRRLARRRPSLAKLLEDTENERIDYLADVFVQLGKERSEARACAEAVYHLYLGWYERHQFEPTASTDIQKQLRVINAITGLDLNANPEENP